MNRIITSLFVSATLVLTLNSCNSSDSSTPKSNPIQETTTTAPEKESASSTPEFSDEQLRARKERKEMLEAQSKDSRENNPVLAKEYNTTSIYRYITTAPEFSIFSKMIIGSGLGKSIHATNMTMFVPNDAAFDNVDQTTFRALFDPAKKDALIKFINNHISTTTIGVEKLSLADGLSDANGNKLKVSDDSVLQVNGAEVIFNDIHTKTGNIIQVKSPIGFPTSL